MRIIIFILLFPVIEILLLATLASHIGLFATLLYLVLSALLGSWMLRNQKIGTLLTLSHVFRQGNKVSIYSLLWPLRYLLAGVLFILPGVLSEIAAIALLLPFKGPQFDLSKRATARPPDRDVIEGEYRRVDTPNTPLGDGTRNDRPS